MRALITARFLRVNTRMINLEVVQQVELRKDGSATVTVPGPRKSLQQVAVPKPYGQELWDFFNENLVVVDIDAERKAADEAKAKPAPKSKEGAKAKSKPKPKATPKKKAAKTPPAEAEKGSE